MARLQNAVLLSANNDQFKTDSAPVAQVFVKLKSRLLSTRRRRRKSFVSQ